MNCISVFIAIFMTFSAYAQNVSSTKKVPEIQAKEKAKITAEAQAKEKAKITAEINKIADLIQKNYNTTSSATFSFEQSYKHAFMATNESSKGKVYFKAQNMLWRYTEPADRQKEFYIAGKKFTYHLINDRLAYTHECFEKDTLSASITFLWGKGKLRESFVIEPYAGKTPNDALKWLVLKPKEKNAPVKSISLGADLKGVVKESIVVDQSDGINHFKFSDFVLNKPIADKTFVFVPAAGVRVQPMPNVVCPNNTPTPPKPTKPAPKK